MRPICATCRLFYKPRLNGYIFCEMVPETFKGKTTYKPYRIWSGDLWECTRCKNQLISGFGKEPISEHFDEDFQDRMNDVMGCVYG